MPQPDYENDLAFPPRHDKTAYELQLENNKLRGLLKECRDWMSWAYAELYEYDPEHESKDTEKLIGRVKSAIGESEE